MAERLYSEPTLEDLEALGVDPAVTRTFGDALAATALLNETPEPTSSEIVQLTHELDRSWPFLRHQCRVSGFLRDATGDGNLLTDRLEYIDDEPMLSNGLYILKEPIYIDDTPIAASFVPVLGFLRQQADGSYYDERGITKELYFTKFDESIIAYPKHSSELGQMYLRRFRPELMKNLDRRLLESTSETGKIMALGSFSVRAEERDKEDFQFRTDLADYLATQIRFDRAHPYFLHTEGSYDRMMEWQDRSLRGYFTVESVGILPEVDPMNENQVVLRPGVQGSLMMGDGTAPVEVHVPAAAIIEFETMSGGVGASE